jgi:hypothetical protein
MSKKTQEIAELLKKHGPCGCAGLGPYVDRKQWGNLSNWLNRACEAGLAQVVSRDGGKVYAYVDPEEAHETPVPIAKPGIGTFWQPVPPWGGPCPQPA